MATKQPLVEIREKAGFETVADAAGAVGYHPYYLRQLESGRIPVSGNAILKLAHAYGLTVETLQAILARPKRKRRAA